MVRAAAASNLCLQKSLQKALLSPGWESKVVKKCDASCCSWQQLLHLRTTDDDHAGEDATSCAMMPAPTTNLSETRGRRPKRTYPRSSRARGTSLPATTSRAARWRTSPSSAHISVPFYLQLCATPRYAIAATHKTPRAGIPLLALLAYYTQYLVLDGSPLVVDFGFDDVPQVIPPGVVWTIFGLLLLPIL